MSAACCLHCLCTRPRAAQSADCITAAVCGFWNGSIFSTFPSEHFFLSRDAVSISNLFIHSFFIFRWDPLMGDQLLPKVNRSFLCLLSNQQGRLTQFHCAIALYCINEQPSTLVMQRLNFEHRSVFRSATGVFPSASVTQKHLLLPGGVATGQEGGYAGDFAFFQSLNSTASRVQIESNTSVPCTSFRCAPLSATAGRLRPRNNSAGLGSDQSSSVR